MIKLNDKRFWVSFYIYRFQGIKFYIVNNNKDEKIKIRHYNIKMFNLYFLYIT